MSYTARFLMVLLSATFAAAVAAMAADSTSPEAPFQADESTVLLWRLDRGPQARSAVPDGPEGKVSGAAWETNGKFKACLSFREGGGLVEATLAKSQLERRRIDLWVNPRAATKPVVLLHEYESPGCNTVLLLEPQGNLKYQRVYCGKPVDSVTSTAKVESGKWSHLALEVCSDVKKVRFFINGKSSGEGTMLLSGTVTRFGLGSGLPGEVIPFAPYRGLIDEVRIERIPEKK